MLYSPTGKERASVSHGTESEFVAVVVTLRRARTFAALQNPYDAQNPAARQRGIPL